MVMALAPLVIKGDRDAKFEILPTNITNIFIPIGSVVPKTDWETLKFNLNITTLFEETYNLCDVVSIIPQFIKKRVSKILSTPNKHVLKVLFRNMKNLCKEDLDAMQQIQDSFGFKIKAYPIENGVRDKRQIAILLPCKQCHSGQN